MIPSKLSSEVTVISVCYNSALVLADMLQSVPEGTPIILVDNASDDARTVAALADKYDAKLLRCDENCGFGRACNQGAAVAETEFLLFLNPDAALAPDALDQLVAAARRYPRVSAMNPRIASADGSASFKRRSCLMPRSERMPRGWPASDCEVPVLSGAALFVRRDCFEAVGGFDPAIFLYHEDDDLARVLRSRFGPLMFIRDALVHHVGGSSSVKSPEIAALKGWYMGRSRVYATRKHGQPMAFAIALWSAVMRLSVIPALFDQRYRAKHWAYFRGVLSALRDGGAHLGPET